LCIVRLRCQRGAAALLSATPSLVAATAAQQQANRALQLRRPAAHRTRAAPRSRDVITRDALERHVVVVLVLVLAVARAATHRNPPRTRATASAGATAARTVCVVCAGSISEPQPPRSLTRSRTTRQPICPAAVVIQAHAQARQRAAAARSGL
jgi:hypothetical protein